MNCDVLGLANGKRLCAGSFGHSYLLSFLVVLCSTLLFLYQHVLLSSHLNIQCGIWPACKSLEFFEILSSLVLCSVASSCLGFSNSQLCLLNSELLALSRLSFHLLWPRSSLTSIVLLFGFVGWFVLVVSGQRVNLWLLLHLC